LIGFEPLGQLSNEVLAIAEIEVSVDFVRRLHFEVRNFPLAFYNESNSDRLYPAGRQAGGDLLPEDRRQLIPYESIEYPPRLLSVDQIFVNPSGIFESVENRLLGNFGKNDSPRLFVVQVQHL